MGTCSICGGSVPDKWWDAKDDAAEREECAREGYTYRELICSNRCAREREARQGGKS